MIIATIHAYTELRKCGIAPAQARVAVFGALQLLGIA